MSGCRPPPCTGTGPRSRGRPLWMTSDEESIPSWSPPPLLPEVSTSTTSDMSSTSRCPRRPRSTCTGLVGLVVLATQAEPQALLTLAQTPGSSRSWSTSWWMPVSPCLTGWPEGVEAMAEEVDAQLEEMEVEEGAMASSGVLREEEEAAPMAWGIAINY